MPLVLLLFFLASAAFPVLSQTIVPEGINDTFNLSCAKCRMRVDGVSLTHGQHALPMNVRKPVSMNLLLWRYYDNILGKQAYMAQKPFWTSAIQLIDEVPDDDLLSLHINLTWTDSLAREHRFYLVMAGLTKRHLSALPVITVTDPQDTYAPLRFSASVQIFHDRNVWETFEALEGIAMLEKFDPRTGSLTGSFDFVAQRVGMEKKGVFQSGWFSR
ncbi:MAG: hypothetical protein NZM43_07945 [Saprospiraceae bacterium]|nr:hypothetical protein [Saprospiraceae bacterium]MDW8484239.1 hypothetical protein [Saprospiraceae bacterium]